MLEKIFTYSNENVKSIQKAVDDDNILINHMIFLEGEGLPEHYANSNVYMLVIQGAVTLRLDDQEAHEYRENQVINIPYHTKMNVNNYGRERLELFVIKAPNPAFYQEGIV